MLKVRRSDTKIVEEERKFVEGNRFFWRQWRGDRKTGLVINKGRRIIGRGEIKEME